MYQLRLLSIGDDMEDKLIRLSDANTLLRGYADQCHGIGKYEKASGVLSALKHLVDIPGLKPNVVTQAEYDYIKRDRDVLRKLVTGEWVDCEEVQRALDITFSQGLKMFDFGRQVAWNKAPKNGQYVVTKFRLDPNKIPDKYSMEFWTQEDDAAYNDFNKADDEINVNELILEQQGGII